MNSCTQCDTRLPDESRFCPRCGTPVPGIDTEELLASSASDPTGLLDRLRSTLGDEFRVIRELGRGGMGRVYLAHELALDRRVAMKVLPPMFAEHRDIVERFKREARTAGKLSHPHIVPVYQVSERNGLTFFTMPYVAGPSLRQVLRRTPQLDPDLARRYLREAADALGFAHSQGVIHRDIKPENMLLEGSRDGRLLLTDFGIAKALDAKTTLTRPGEMMGTPYYMSPEQCKQGEEIDGRSDQYSLGLVGWEMLAGKFPFSADSMAAIVYQHLHEDPEPLEQVRPDVPDDLRTVVARAIRKKPEDRYATMYDVLESLAVPTVVATGPASSRPRTRSPARKKRRHWLPVAGAAVVVALSAASLVLWQGRWGDSSGTRLGELAVVPGNASSGAAANEGAAADSVGLLDRSIERGQADGPNDASAPAGDPANGSTDGDPPASELDESAARGDPVGDAAAGDRRTARTVGTEGEEGGEPTVRAPDTAGAGETDAGESGQAREASGQNDALARIRDEIQTARQEADAARSRAQAAGADSLFPAEYRMARQAQTAGLAALRNREPGRALRSYRMAEVRYDSLTARSIEVWERESRKAGREGVEEGAAVAGGDTLPTEPADEPDVRAVPAGEAIGRLLDAYRRAVEAEDLEALRTEVYSGTLPANDARTYNLWFGSAEDLSVSLEIQGQKIEGDRAELRARQTMSYRLARTGERRGLRLDLTFELRQQSEGWRVTRMEARR